MKRRSDCVRRRTADSKVPPINAITNINKGRRPTKRPESIWTMLRRGDAGMDARTNSRRCIVVLDGRCASDNHQLLLPCINPPSALRERLAPLYEKSDVAVYEDALAKLSAPSQRSRESGGDVHRPEIDARRASGVRTGNFAGPAHGCIRHSPRLTDGPAASIPPPLAASIPPQRRSRPKPAPRLHHPAQLPQ